MHSINPDVSLNLYPHSLYKFLVYKRLTLYLPVSSADNLCKQFGPRSVPTKCQALSESNLFNTLMVFLKEFFKKVVFEKNQQMTLRVNDDSSRTITSSFSRSSSLFFRACLNSLCSFLASNSVNFETKIHK